MEYLVDAKLYEKRDRCLLDQETGGIDCCLLGTDSRKGSQDGDVKVTTLSVLELRPSISLSISAYLQEVCLGLDGLRSRGVLDGLPIIAIEFGYYRIHLGTDLEKLGHL